MSAMNASLGLYETYELLLNTIPSEVTEETEERLSDEAWELWSKSLFYYPDSLVPVSVLGSYLDEIEADMDGFY